MSRNRICHVCLSNWFVDDVGYQENELVRQNVDDGHEVLVIASTEMPDAHGKLKYVKAGEYTSSERARIIRLPYRKGFPPGLKEKLRMHGSVRTRLDEFGPDTILFHGTCGWELLTVARYARDHPSVSFYIDSHSDFVNSARNFVSRNFLHKGYYRPVLRSAVRHAKKIFCVSKSSAEFLSQLYGIPDSMLEFFPLGGRPVPDDEYEFRRASTRTSLNVGGDDVVLIQSGKQTSRKSLLESLRAFSATQDRRLRYFVAGMLCSDIQSAAQQLIAEDERISYLGWQSVDELTSLLCAADVYVQPGTQSATMQHSLCCRCAVVLPALRSHEPYMSQNGWFFESLDELPSIFDAVAHAELQLMGKRSLGLAKTMLDYKVLSTRYLS